MGLLVQKYGGTSVQTIERIKQVAEKIRRAKVAGRDLVVVVSAMAGETNRLLSLAHEISEIPDEREKDVLLASGEQVAVALLSLALKELGQPARSLLGHQVRIETDNAYGKACIRNIDSTKILQSLKAGEVVVVAGFQGVDEDDNITTLGRGGSDTSAVALAAFLNADACEIYTDVEGTWLVKEDASMDDVLVSGVSCDKNEAKLTLLRVPDRPGLAAQVFGPIADAHIVVDMIIQNASDDGTIDLTFTVTKTDHKKALAIVEKTLPAVNAQGVKVDTDIAKVSVVGVGMRTHAGVAAKMFEVLGREGINIEMISTSEIKISVVIDAKYTELAMRVLHDAFIGNQGNV